MKYILYNKLCKKREYLGIGYMDIYFSYQIHLARMV